MQHTGSCRRRHQQVARSWQKDLQGICATALMNLLTSIGLTKTKRLNFGWCPCLTLQELIAVGNKMWPWADQKAPTKQWKHLLAINMHLAPSKTWSFHDLDACCLCQSESREAKQRMWQMCGNKMLENGKVSALLMPVKSLRWCFTWQMHEPHLHATPCLTTVAIEKIMTALCKPWFLRFFLAPLGCNIKLEIAKIAFAQIDTMRTREGHCSSRRT